MVLAIIVSIAFVISLITMIQSSDNILTFITFITQMFLWYGLYHYQAARYDDKKIMAQYGWPRIYYKDIVSIRYKWGNIIIASDTKKIHINKNAVEEESLNAFIEHLEHKTSNAINKSVLLQ